MIFMGMGEYNTEDIMPVLFDEIDVRHNDINARCVGTAKCDAHIDDNPFTVMFRSKPK